MTAALIVEGAALQLGSFRLRGLDLAVERGEILALLGPNGAGKSVSLEMIAGFHMPQRGRIAIGGRDVTRLPPERRGVGLVVQDFGLFPHLSVAGNLAFGRQRADIPALLAQFGIARLAERMPQQLSAGERQRTALARALATRPDLFLFDEPFSALDARSRAGLREELGAFLRSAAIPAIFVTHDPEEACTLADRAAVMRDGAIVQQGDMEAVFRRPAAPWIARFVGVDNMLAGRIVARSAVGCRVAVGAAMLAAAKPTGGAEVVACIRADEVELLPPGEAAPGRLSGRVTAIANLGGLQRLTVDCGFPLKALVTNRQFRALGLRAGAAVAAEIDPEAVHLLPAESLGGAD
jgi:molybdate/tungstate transport system ATP-binding protein